MSKKNSRDGGLVFSTEPGRICLACKKLSSQCGCRKESTIPLSDGIVRISMETKGRKGKGVTLVTGLALDPEELRKIVRELKKKCGCGGAIKDGVLEIQGDHRDLLMAEFAAQGYKVKRVGG
ncbi:MAG: translation initiation factor Sui1 [Proteobacteria bacterium]|nr:translation initiation factor Sui1 [Pseudomonadota bacterium]MBU1648582.1 translation initiation factor Sui1 [Pseudomonadota bacterium]MBU1986520.1 translation initiation factor Sui1 [Pseudomonadota bacterium]